MRAAFAIRAWAATAPGLQSQDKWLQWAEVPVCPVGNVVIELPHVPAMSRRRLGHLAKMAVSVADTVLPPERRADIPVVWASRYGDAEKAIGLLQAQALGEPMSPTAFGLAVHNGVGAQHSILHGMKANGVCVASSHCAPESGVVEALGILNDGAEEVLLVCYDQPLPSAYAVFHDEPVAEFAWAVLVAPLHPGGPGFTLRAQDGVLPQGDGGNPVSDALPHGLNVLHFLLYRQRQRLVHGHASGQWIWERVHA